LRAIELRTHQGGPRVSRTQAVRTIALALLFAVASGAALPAVAVAQAGAGETGGWTVYHGDPGGSGTAASVTSVDLSPRAWTSPTLDGQIYGEPLDWDGHVYVASEHNTVYALSAATGEVVWSTNLGAPVPSSVLPCGNISPTVGITGTPVVDSARSEVFVVADELVGQRPAHMLVGLDARTGAVELTQDVDPPRSTPAALLQRTGLTLDANRVVFGFGGNYGDCPSYHGWVVSVPETGGAAENYAVDSGAGQSQGAIWMGGAAPVVDAAGNIWVEAGNGSVTSSGAHYDHSDSVLQLSPALVLEQYFAPSSWASENANDLDLSTAPALLDDGEVVAAGKDANAYLLDGTHLGGIGGEQASLTSACPQDIDGGPAFVGTTVYLPCLNGPVAVQVSSSPARLRLLWRATSGGGPPIVAGGLVWSIGQNGILYGLDPATGSVVKQASVGRPANHFPTPSVGDGLLLVPGATDVVAFHAATSSATTTTTSSAPTTSTTHGASSSRHPPPQGIPAAAIAATVLGALAVAAGALWIWRRARRRHGVE
jgi:outer membrane protein assembly factor BamB